MTTTLQDPAPAQTKDKNQLSFWEHLDAFRSLILKSLGIFLLSCILVACFFPHFADIMNKPLLQAAGNNEDILQGLVTTSPMGIFSVLIQICFLGGLALSCPIVLYMMAKFIAPALSQKEKKILIPGCLSAFLLFAVGALFSYYLVLPASLVVSMQLNKLFGFQLIWSAPHYYGLVVWMTLGIGLAFEFPLILLLLVLTGILSTKKLSSIRRYMIVGILVVCAAIIPGGDPLSLMIMATPLYGAYEAVICFGRRIERKRAQAENSNYSSN